MSFQDLITAVDRSQELAKTHFYNDELKQNLSFIRGFVEARQAELTPVEKVPQDFEEFFESKRDEEKIAARKADKKKRDDNFYAACEENASRTRK